MTSSQPLNIIENNLAAQQQPLSKVIKEKKLRFLKKKKDRACLDWEIFRLKQKELRGFVSSNKKKATAVAKLNEHFDVLVWDQIAFQHTCSALILTIYTGCSQQKFNAYIE